MILHPINQHLPRITHEILQQNDQENHRDISNIFESIMNSPEMIVNSKLLGKVLRLIESRFTMKYIMTVEILTNYLKSIIQIYLTKRISIPMKIKCLNVALKILKYRKSCLNLIIPWEIFWDEIFTICTRTAKDQSIACEGLNMKLFEALTNFVHEARHYFPSDSYVKILTEGMNLLEDLRNPMCFFGLQMFILLLPTSLPPSAYDEILPRWIALFTKISDNEAWDCCFLTLFCRARKYLTSFDWTTLIPLLQIKTKNLLQFPVTKGMNSKVNSYPNTFPPYIVALKVSPMDYRKTALKKISKLLYLICYQGEIVHTPPCTITPPIQARDIPVIGMNQPASIYSGAKELILFLQIHRSFFYPSNTGSWTADIGYFLLCLSNEIGQHLGQSVLRSAAFDSLYEQFSATTSAFSDIQTASLKNILQDTTVHSSATIHQPTFKYLCGALTSIVLEGLYGKSPFMIQSCNFCLRNICAVEPSLGQVIMPFLLYSLHPDAVNQSHMAPSSLTAINHIFKPLLYPEPVVLPYLDELLQLSLAGIDPNDSQKTMTTLAMYNTVFSWIPTSTIGNDDVQGQPEVDCTIPPLYLELGTGMSASNSEQYAILFNDKISNVIISWYPKFIEKLFLLLNSKEKAGESKATRQPSPITPYIEESFYEIISCLAPNLRLSVLNMVLDYSNTSHAPNVIKEIGKMLENLLALDPSFLQIALEKLIDLDLISCDGSNERLSMKVRLVGACLRRVGGNSIIGVREKIKFLFEDDFKHHTEKVVRKAVCKFYKDLLKGLTSFYVLPTSPNASEKGFYVLGKPHHAQNVDVTWHIPSAEAVAEAVSILKLLTSSSMNAVEAIFKEIDLPLADATDDQSLSVKKQEEKMLTHLQILRRCLRGSAEILGESSFPTLEESFSVVEDNNEEDVDGEEPNLDQEKRLLIETGRTKILESLAPEDRLYLDTLRFNVVSFLNRIYGYLSNPITNPAPILANLRNNPSIHSAWMKIFAVTVMIRMAMLKNIDQVKKWFALAKRMVKSSTVSFMEKKLKRIQFIAPHLYNSIATENWGGAIRSCEYWIGHDLSIRSIGDRSWIQHVLREKELSYQSTSYEQKALKLRSVYVIALTNLAKICGHEYDAIRSKAIKIFREVSSRFGSSLEMILRPLLSSLSVTGTVYSAASGALSVLSLDLVQKRICGNASLSSSFLKTVRSFPNLVNSVEEVDKREKLADKMSSIFGKYLSNWHHMPFNPWTSSHQKAPMSKLLIQFLSDFGVRNSNDFDDAGVSNPQVLEIVNDSVVSMGIRQQLYLASIITIFLGHNDIEVPVGVWEWAVTTVSKAHGQPIQFVSLTALTKLATIEYRKVLSLSTLSPAQSNIQSIVRNLFSSESSILSFLSGISASHAQSHGNNNNAQWSKGVDIMLRNSEYIRNVLPRTETSYCDIAVFSSHFKHSSASMIMQLLYLSGLDLDNLGSVIGNVLQSSSSIPSTNEEEIRSANTVRAELFSGIVRFVRQREFSGIPLAATEAIWLDLLSYLNENVSKISQEYCSDWAEGLAFGFSGSPNSPSNSVCNSLLQSVQQLLLSSADHSNTSPGEGSSSGFAKDTKTLLLMRALLVADISAVSRSNQLRFIPVDQREVDPSQRTSQIGFFLLESISQISGSNLTNSIFLSPYLAVRIEMTKLFVRLVDVFTEKSDLSNLLQCILFGTTTTQINTVDDGKLDSDVKQVDAWKLSCDIACRFMERLFHSTIFSKYESILCSLLNIAIEGCGHYDIEFSKLCHQICLKTSEQIKICTCQSRDDSQSDVLTEIIQLFSKQMNSTSLHVRETVIMCLGIIFIHNYPLLTTNEKKICKDIFTNGLHDPKPEVQVLSIVGMTTYLSIKTIDELTTLAASYVKNSDILATREKKKRKQNKDGTSTSSSTEKLDPIYLTTIKMSACMILLYPYDLPKYLPTLITSFIRHDANPVMKETIMKTIQDFKRTHQDRWNEFQLEFTREQLDDLQGAGAAHYFS